MSTVKVSLAEPAARWVDEQVNSGRFPDASSLVMKLIERERINDETLAALHAALDEGEASGDSGMTIDEIFEGSPRPPPA